VESYFPQYFTAQADPLKKKINLRHILTMTAGLKIEAQSPEENKIFASADPAQTTFEFPMATKPGEKFKLLNRPGLCDDCNFNKNQRTKPGRDFQYLSIRTPGNKKCFLESHR